MSWPIVTLNDIAINIVDGPFGSSLKTSDYVDEGVPVLQGKNITGNRFKFFDVRYITEKKAESIKRSTVKVGDHLLVKIGSIGYSAIIDDLYGHDFAIIPANLAKITPNKEVIDSRYLHHYLTSDSAIRYFQKIASKTAQPALSLSKIKSLEIPLPPLAEQRRIASILDQADELRQKRQQAIEKLDQLLQATFIDMFGDPVSNPKGWEKETIGNLTTFITSGSRGWAQYYADSGSKFIRIQNLVKGDLDMSDCAYVNAPDSAEAKRTLVQAGDVLVSITADLGRTAVVPNDIGMAHINQHVAILRLTGVNPAFISHYLASVGGKVQFEKLNRSAVKAGLNFNDIRSLEVLLPPQEHQNKYVQIVHNIKNHQHQLIHFKKQSDILFSSLQNQAFNGTL